MLTYFKNGTRVDLTAIYAHGQPGQPVILAHVHFGKDAKNPLAAYSQPTAFTIAETTDSSYRLKGPKGEDVWVNFADSDTSYLYDATEWAQYTEAHEADHLARKEGKIAMLEAHLQLLKSILTAQGIRIVTETQAKALGLREK
jgi:hypothetical protein